MNDDRCCAPQCHNESSWTLVQNGKRYPLCDTHGNQVLSMDPEVEKKARARFKIPMPEKAKTVESNSAPPVDGGESIMERLAAGAYDFDDED